MKIAVISDIHGNMSALNKVLEDIKANDCDKIFCLGDLALAGPEPEKTVSFVKSQNDWVIIQGNTDKMIAECTPELIDATKKAFCPMGFSLESDVEILCDENKAYLKNLPPQQSLEVEGLKILLVHGSPRRNNENIYPELPMNEIEQIIDGVKEDLILCGHTHIPAGYQTDSKKTIVNVGSVGRPLTSDAKPCYLILSVIDGKFSVQHKFIDYDRKTAATMMKNRGFEGAEDIANMLLKNQ